MQKNEKYKEESSAREEDRQSELSGRDDKLTEKIMSEPGQDVEEVSLHRNKPGATRKFLLSAAVIAGLLAIIGLGFISGMHYQTIFLSGQRGGSDNKSYEMYFQEGESFQEDEAYAEALESYMKIGESYESYDKVKENIEICRSYYCVGTLTRAQIQLKEGKTEDALEILCRSLQVLGDNDDIKNAIKKISNAGDKKKVELDLPEGKEDYQK